MATPEPATAPEPEHVSFKDFLEKVPPGRTVIIDGFSRPPAYSSQYSVLAPDIQVTCDSEICGGVRLFTPDHSFATYDELSNIVVRYTCRNCDSTYKRYAFWLALKRLSSAALAYKYGEYPAFGPTTPARVITILGPEREYYLKGRRAESQGMGIAAFAYYRRVVENQKNRLLNEIIRVAEQAGASEDMIGDLKAAQNETQFSKAVDTIKHGIPQGLLVNGHNPLSLLHSALSEGLHAQTDEQCLALATSIRVVLADLADRLGHAMKERAELNAAVSRLLK